jgi:hypothetical protein
MTRRILSFCAGALSWIALWLLLSGYGNRDMHPAINEPIIDAFVDRFINAIGRPETFKNYTFVFDGSSTFEGPAVTNAGYFAATTGESMVRKTPKQWISHGGYSADEPEVPAALRHFYDPTGIDGGKKYLTDRGTYWEFIINNYFLNPQIDAKEWALHHSENSWTWDKGKEWMRRALAEEDETARDRHMARAWRCLGETLHLVADMGCPPHVRNDSHAAPVGWQFRAALGDPDPYEELVKPSYVAKYAAGAVDPALRTAVRAADRADVIFEEMARFTNSNFFTAQTISGRGGRTYQQIIRPSAPYTSPKLEQLSYSPSTYEFTKVFPGGQTAVMCKDEGYFFLRSYPYMDAACVESQSAVLIPNVLEAGANIIRLFITKLEVSISSATADGKVEGSVSMRTGAEYPTVSAVAGRVFLFKANRQIGEGTLESDGAFAVEGLALEDGAEIVAEYRCGGMFVRSEEYTVGDTGLLARVLASRAVLVTFSAVNTYTGVIQDDLISIGNYSPIPEIGLAPLSWSGRSFSFTLDWTNPQNDHHIFTVTGSISTDGRTVTDFEAYEMLSFQGRIHIETTRLKLRNLPYDEDYNIVPSDDMDFGMESPDARNMFVSMTRNVYEAPMEGDPGYDYDYVSTDWDNSDTPYIYVQFFR